jgi:hypothetical protein
VNDLIRHNQAAVAQALRRLADAALDAAEDPTDPDRIHKVDGRVDSVRHARAVLTASRSGSQAGAA